MLSTEYRLRLEFICNKIVNKEEVQLADMIWAEKLAKANRSANELMRKARRKANNPDMVEGGLDDFMNNLDLGDPDPANHRTAFSGPDDIAQWFSQEKTDDWRQRD
tara:strand:- start:190 stop:507 length:318 start_codon:yes stop_codon:yes gene_type:complete